MTRCLAVQVQEQDVDAELSEEFPRRRKALNSGTRKKNLGKPPLQRVNEKTVLDGESVEALGAVEVKSVQHVLPVRQQDLPAAHVCPGWKERQNRKYTRGAKRTQCSQAPSPESPHLWNPRYLLYTFRALLC